MFNVAPADQLVLGLATGLAFGFLLHRGGVTQYRVIVGQFLMKDHTVLRTMLTAVVVGAVGVYAMQSAWFTEAVGPVKMHVKNAVVLANVLGGILFGAGMLLLGYCPGTGVAALGTGSRHALSGVLGMLAGAAVYAEVHPLFYGKIQAVCDLGKATLPEVTGLPPWLLTGALAVIAGVLFSVLRGGGTAAGERS
ncbi:MAG: YeeE/YedE family protein [Pirellulales bacterium]|nr:YeeE/YedE family protein [Pirellulales bacterium]